jgi:hypothetical protein
MRCGSASRPVHPRSPVVNPANRWSTSGGRMSNPSPSILARPPPRYFGCHKRSGCRFNRAPARPSILRLSGCFEGGPNDVGLPHKKHPSVGLHADRDGFDRIQRSESVSIALDRISADIGASEYMRPNRQTKNVLFSGSESSLTFVRASLGPNASRGLDVVRIAEAADRDGSVLTRSHAAFMPGAETEPNFADPVVLLRAPYRVSFSYADRERAHAADFANSGHPYFRVGGKRVRSGGARRLRGQAGGGTG